MRGLGSPQLTSNIETDLTIEKTEAEMPTVKVGDINMHYEIHGEGEPLLLIMGLGGVAGMWWLQVPAFSQGYRVIIFDNRGVGQTDKPDIPYSVRMMTNDAAALLEALGIPSAHVYGISLGGLIAQGLALSYPDKVISLVLGATSSGGPYAVAPSPEVSQQLLDMATLPPEKAVELFAQICFSPAFIESNPGRVAELLEKGMETPASSPVGYRRQWEASMRFNAYDQLPQIKAPTLVIAGTDDRLLPAENSRILASRIPNAELVLLDGLGHGYAWEADEKSNQIVLDFLRRHRCSR